MDGVLIMLMLDSQKSCNPCQQACYEVPLIYRIAFPILLIVACTIFITVSRISIKRSARKIDEKRKYRETK